MNEYTEYAADMNLLLSYYKCMDDWKDDRKYRQKAYAGLLSKGYGRLEGIYGKKIRKIEKLMGELGKEEKAGCRDVDKMARLFGKVMAEILVCKEDVWKENLYRMGLYLGKFIYLCDAYEDIGKDLKTGSYNPLICRYGLTGGELTEEAREGLAVSLDHSIRLMAAAYELWDFGVWSPIIRATVYEGLFLVGRAVLEGTFQAGDAGLRMAARNKEQL